MSTELQHLAGTNDPLLAIETAVRVRTGGRIRGLRVRLAGGSIVISGCVSTLYTKQLVTLAAMEASGESDVRNEIIVDSDSSAAAVTTATAKAFAHGDTTSFPVRVYLSDAVSATEVEAAVRNALMSWGIMIYHEEDPIRSSWYRQLLACFVGVTTHDEVLSRLEKIERGLDLRYLDGPQAAADQPRLEAAAAMLTAIGNNEAVVHIGSIIIIKSSSRVIAKTLSQTELQYLEENPDMFRNPEVLLKHLSAVPEKSVT